MADLNTWEKIFFLNPKLPALGGGAEIDLGIELRKDKGYLFNVDLDTRDVKISKFVVGKVKGKAVSDLKSIRSELIELENNSGKARIEKAVLNLEPKPTFSANASVQGIELAAFLKNLGLPKPIPLYLLINGHANCEGSIKEPLEVNCAAKINSPRLWVHSGPPKKKTIVEALDLRAQGNVKITAKDVDYKAEIQVGKNSKGSSNGNINYDTGFKINYVGDDVSFADVKNLADLKFEGTAKITGNTIGTADWATIDMDVKRQEFLARGLSVR